jgi:hypothetical protein
MKKKIYTILIIIYSYLFLPAAGAADAEVHELPA